MCRGRRGDEARRRPTLPHCGAVPSARAGLTSLFGMGRGGAPQLWPPCVWRRTMTRDTERTRAAETPQGAARRPPQGGRGSGAISIARLRASPPVHLRPIHVIVSDGPVRPNLAAGFALRCLQRLSTPDAATLPCTWRYNRLTGGRSGTVLSY